MRSFLITSILLLASVAFAQEEPPPAEVPPPAEPPAAEPPPAETPPADAPAAAGSAESGVYAAGTMGLQFAVPSGGAPTAGVTYFISPDAALRIDLGFLYTTSEDATGASASGWGFSIELGYRMYRLAMGRLRPFIQPSLFISKAAEIVPEGADGSDFGQLLTVALTGGFGIEYMFSDRFSIGGQTGLSLVFANEFKNINFSTGTSALFAAFYF